MLQTELSKCWAARTFAEAQVSELQAEIDGALAKQRSLEGNLKDAQRKCDEQASTIDALRREAEFNSENASLFKSEQDRCLALMAELHELQTRTSAEISALRQDKQQLEGTLDGEQRKVASLKVCDAPLLRCDQDNVD